MKRNRERGSDGKSARQQESNRAQKAGTQAGGTAKLPGDEIVDMEEAIGMLKTTRPTFYRWLRSGKIKGMKVGRQWRFFRKDIEQFLKGEAPRVDLPVDISPVVNTLRQRLSEIKGDDLVPGNLRPVEQAVRLMIALGFRMRASDIHITAHSQGAGGPVTVLRYRVDGVLHAAAEIDQRLLPAIIEEWKRMASCDIHEKARPQDGRIQVRIPGAPERVLDLRVSIIPAVLGESLTARLLDQASALVTLDRLPFSERDQSRIENALHLPWGIVIGSGPTGSGKTTTLYACLTRLAKPEMKVVTVEDPVEYILPWATQVPVRPEIGVTFAAATRAILRSDPDVLMIGEIRDRETLMVAIQAALTGHLVLTTLHTSDAASALTRMADIGVDPFLIADSVKLVIAQRLVRKLCDKCAVEQAPARDVLDEMERVARSGGLDWDGLPRNFRKPVGCANCARTGHRGRTMIVETLEVTPDIGKALREGRPLDEIRVAAIRSGTVPMLADGIRRVAAGEVTWTEVLRVARSY